MISDDLRNRLRIAAALAVATACSRRAPEPADASPAAAADGLEGGLPTVLDASLATDPLPAGAAADGGALGRPGTSDSDADAGYEAQMGRLSTFGHDPCPGCGMGGRLPQYHQPPKVDCVIGPTEPEVARSKPRLLACYENSLFARPDIGGRTILRLAVNEKGEVTKSEVVESQVKGVFNVCIEDAGKHFHLKPGAARTVVVPLFFYHEHG